VWERGKERGKKLGAGGEKRSEEGAERTYWRRKKKTANLCEGLRGNSWGNSRNHAILSGGLSRE